MGNPDLIITINGYEIYFIQGSQYECNGFLYIDAIKKVLNRHKQNIKGEDFPRQIESIDIKEVLDKIVYKR